MKRNWIRSCYLHWKSHVPGKFVACSFLRGDLGARPSPHACRLILDDPPLRERRREHVHTYRTPHKTSPFLQLWDLSGLHRCAAIAEKSVSRSEARHLTPAV